MLPFQVRDADGATAAASVYIPPTGDGLPYVLPGSLIELDSGRAARRARSPTTSPRPTAARCASRSGRRSYSASPTSLTVGPDGRQPFTLSAPAGFRGPGSVLVEVTTATDASGNEDATTTEDGVTAILSIPVVVGDDVPSLECPSNRHPDVGRPALRPRHRVVLHGLHRRPPRRRRTSTSPPSGARPSTASTSGAPWAPSCPSPPRTTPRRGRRGRLTVRAGESNPQEVRFRLAQAPPPRLNPIRVETMEAGQSRTYDMARLPPGRRRQPRSHHRAGAEHRDARREGQRRRQPAHADGRARHPRRGARRSGWSSATSSDGDPPSSRTAEGRIPFTRDRHALAAR